MSKKVFGTNAIGGLDVSKSGHLIADSSLTKSENGWTDKEGSLSCARGPELLYSGYSDISCFAAGRVDGTDSLAWMDGDDVYVDGNVVGTITAGDDMYCRDFDDSFYFMGGDKNYIWDGSILRQHGPWQITEWSRGSKDTFVRESADSQTISGITKANPGVITLSGAHTVAEGESFYVSGVTGMTELNGRIFVAAAVTGTTITLEEDTSDYGTYSSGGTVYTFGCGLDGDYMYYMVPTVKIVDSGLVLSGKPRGVVFGSSAKTFTESDSYEAEAVTLSPTNEVQFKVSITPSYSSSGTVDTDYLIGLRLYRTKADGVDYYLEHEWWSTDDEGVDVSSGEYTFYSQLGVLAGANFRSKTLDQDLGAVYLPGPSDHDTPPASSLMALVGQRLYLNDTSNPKRLYFSHLDGVDYVPTLNYLTFPDVITGIGQAGSACIVFSADRMWRVTLLGGLPDVDEIETAVGTTFGRAMTTNENGLMFLREDGMWSTDGASPPVKLSRPAFGSISSPVSLCSSGDTLYLSGASAAYVALRRSQGVLWHEHQTYENHADASGGVFYTADAHNVYKLFTGGYLGADIESKVYTDYVERKITRVVLDYEGDDSPVVWINGNRLSDYDGHAEDETATTGYRRLLRFPIGRLMNHTYSIAVSLSGNAILHGMWLEGE